MIRAVAARRSIRKYRSDEVPRQYIEDIIRAGTLAPSSKNRQPWRFTVVRGEAKKEMLSAMESGLAREKKNPLLPGSSKLIKGAEYTLSIMKQAPVIIFVINRYAVDIRMTLDVEERIYEICNAQSIGAAIENMTLTATELGLGSLWICDTYFAYEELTNWLGTKGALYAALAVGYADESPALRPRKDINIITEWR